MFQPPPLPTIADHRAQNFSLPGGTTVANPHLQRHQGHPVNAQRPNLQPDIYADGIIPDVETLRRIPTIAQSVTSALAAYEDQPKLLSMQGKHLRRSGRYNTGETVNTLPENRWPNKGFHASTGKKRVRYDDLTLPQWITGQLSNIYHMRDQTTAGHALLQVILAMKDATSLPWTAVRSAWAMSMHDLEEGNTVATQ